MISDSFTLVILIALALVIATIFVPLILRVWLISYYHSVISRGLRCLSKFLIILLTTVLLVIFILLFRILTDGLSTFLPLP